MTTAPTVLKVFPGTDFNSTAQFELEEIPYDPDTVNLKVRHPDGTVDEYVYGVDAIVVRVSDGQYTAQINVDVTGYWSVRWEGIGPDEIPDIAYEVEVLGLDSQFL